MSLRIIVRLDPSLHWDDNEEDSGFLPEFTLNLVQGWDDNEGRKVE